jgi:hypothetical protein
MRRLVFTCALLLGIAGPAGAAVLMQTPNDGTLVVQNADNGDGIAPGARAVVTLVVHGFVIGQVLDQGRIQIFDLDPTDQSEPEVTGALSHRDVVRTIRTQSGVVTQAGTQWTGTGFRFRAVEGTYRVVIWGSGVYLFASGDKGQVWFNGQLDTRVPDGTFSLDGDPFRSLPPQGTRDIAPPVTG